MRARTRKAQRVPVGIYKSEGERGRERQQDYTCIAREAHGSCEPHWRRVRERCTENGPRIRRLEKEQGKEREREGNESGGRQRWDGWRIGW